MPSTLLHFSLLVSILFFALEQFLLFIPTKVKVKTLHFPHSWGPRSHPWHLSWAFSVSSDPQMIRKSHRAPGALRTVLRIYPALWGITRHEHLYSSPASQVLGQWWHAVTPSPVCASRDGDVWIQGKPRYHLLNTSYVLCSESQLCHFIWSSQWFLEVPIIYYPNFTGDEIEILGKWVTCRRSHCV